jgi:phosphopantetheinyl transferase
MPLKNVYTIKNTAIRVAVWHITETEEQLLPDLPVYCFAELQTIKHPQKRKEYIASRLLVSYLVTEQQEFFWGIEKNQHNQPFLTHLKDTCISISHSHNYAACAVYVGQKMGTEKTSIDKIGIDIEQISDKITHVIDKFLTDKEKLQVGNSLEKLCQYWCAKEAMYKYYGEKNIIYKTMLQLYETDNELSGVISTPQLHREVKFFTEKIDGYMLVVCF